MLCRSITLWVRKYTFGAFEIELLSFLFEWFKPCTAVGAELSYVCKCTIKSTSDLKKKKGLWRSSFTAGIENL